MKVALMIVLACLLLSGCSTAPSTPSATRLVTYPELVAAAAPLSFADIRFASPLRSEGFEVLSRPYSDPAFYDWLLSKSRN
jgi:hypothetical protein